MTLGYTLGLALLFQILWGMGGQRDLNLLNNIAKVS